MGVPFRQAQENLKEAVSTLYELDYRVRSVGITRHEEQYGYHVVKNSKLARALRGRSEEISHLKGVPIVFTNIPTEVRSMVLVPHSGPAAPPNNSLVPEVNRHRPLTWGLQVQNFDRDDQEGIFSQNFMRVGTLGCFVYLPTGEIALLSNNHVIAGENQGKCGVDRILQPGSSSYNPNDQIAVLNSYIDLQYSSSGVGPDDAIYNKVDAAVAHLSNNVTWRQNSRLLKNSPTTLSPTPIKPQLLGTRVYKVGRTTGLTYGEITEISTVVGPIGYEQGECWFQNSIVVEGENDAIFSNQGDSGSLVVSVAGEVIGLVYAGNGVQTYVCSVTEVLDVLGCTFA